MAHHLANGSPAHLLMWRRVREYAVPPSMIETATARRTAGDWAGACAAARMTVDLDLRALRHRYGAGFAARLREDLRRLAPDLLRWHMPRIAPDGRLRPGLTLCLARYGAPGDPGGPGGTPLWLVVRTPPVPADAGQWMSLALWEGPGPGTHGHHPHPYPDRRFRLDLHRHLWDAGRAGELARRCGADGSRAASSACRPLPAGLPPGALPFAADLHDGAPGSSWAVAGWAAEAELLLRSEGRPRGAFTVRLGARRRAVLELVAPDDSHAPALLPLRETMAKQQIAALPMLPEAAARVLPDLELLRAGLIPPERLHPLVAAALPTADLAAPYDDTLDSVPADPHRVECRGEVHRIALRDGVLAAVDHDPAEVRREELLVALGGPALPCIRAIDAVHRSPEALPAVRERLGHGDVAGALDVVVGLLGPGAMLRAGPLREELESAAARRVDYGIFRTGLTDPHPAAAGAAGKNTPSTEHADTSHRPRPDRRMPVPMRRKRDSRSRPRTGLFG